MDDLITSFGQLNDPMDDLVNEFTSSISLDENIEILCKAITDEMYIMDNVRERLTDEFIARHDGRIQKYMQRLGDYFEDEPHMKKRIDVYLNISKRRQKFRLLMFIDQYMIREVIKLYPDAELDEYLMDFPLNHKDNDI